MINLTLAWQRLHQQWIVPPTFEKPEDVVRQLGAMQAQDYQQALWAVGVRLRSTTRLGIEQAIADARIVRTWPMRGTIHFVPSEDAQWMLRLCAARVIAKSKRRQDQLALNAGILERCQAVFFEALNGGRRLSRPGMLQALEAAGISTTGQRGYHILVYAAQLGQICLGPRQDNEQTFVLLDEWVPQSRTLSREESLIELTRRYFTGHGPATVHDFGWWSGLTITDIRAGLEAAKPTLISEKIEGKEYWMSGNAPDLQFADPAAAVLLPGYDEYLLGYSNRGAILDPQYAQKVCPGGNGVFASMVVVDGQVVGTWKRTFKKGAVVIASEAFTHFSDDQAALIEAAAQRYGAFLEMPVIFS